MWIKNSKKAEQHMKRKKTRLSQEIMQRLFVSAATGFFFYVFLRCMLEAIAENYVYSKGITVTEMQVTLLNIWMRNLCILSASFVFLVLFMFLIGQKIAYLNSIIKNVEEMRNSRLENQIPVAGNDELAELAEMINHLAQSQRELNQKEKELQVEREEMIRHLSHDIRTPLTTILSYTEFIQAKETITEDEMNDYIQLMRDKAGQIKTLTERLLEHGSKNKEVIREGRLFLEQLAVQWEELLEEMFPCRVDILGRSQLQMKVDMQDVQRIFDNLISNVERYAALGKEVFLSMGEKDGRLYIVQKNTVKQLKDRNPDSCGIGLKSIRGIVEEYRGSMAVEQSESEFMIRITMPVLWDENGDI